jgi:hypothetical protein
MMDIFLVRQCSRSKIQSFLSKIFDCSVDRVKVLGIEEFNSLTEELDHSSFDCVCAFSSAKGDVVQLLQLYRYKVSDLEAVRRTVDIALANKIHCYLPSDSLDGWIFVGDFDVTKKVQQIQCEQDDCYLFKLI